jgi:hypothetical protein
LVAPQGANLAAALVTYLVAAALVELRAEVRFALFVLQLHLDTGPQRANLAVALGTCLVAAAVADVGEEVRLTFLGLQLHIHTAPRLSSLAAALFMCHVAVALDAAVRVVRLGFFVIKCLALNAYVTARCGSLDLALVMYWVAIMAAEVRAELLYRLISLHLLMRGTHPLTWQCVTALEDCWIAVCTPVVEGKAALVVSWLCIGFHIWDAVYGWLPAGLLAT